LATIYRHSPLPPAPADPTSAVASDPRAVRLGEALFFDTRLSANGRISCATCHRPERAFTDGRPLAKGMAVGKRNAPTLLNAAFGRFFFWDGRADSLWAQALQPLENPGEAGTDRLHIAHVVARDPALRTAYSALFGMLPDLSDPKRFPGHARPDRNARSPLARAWAHIAPRDRDAVDRLYSNLGKAFEAYERTLVDRSSPFDRYVAGLRSGDRAGLAAVSPAAKRGLRLFVGKANCELCHSGPAFSDGMFHNLGLPLLPGETGDTGRAGGLTALNRDPFNGASRFSDNRQQGKAKLAFLPTASSERGAFKTPGLRDVARTAPYMHDGRFATLDQVLDFYAKGAAAVHGRTVGKREMTANLVPHLSRKEKNDVIAFLRTLSGVLPDAVLRPITAP
jgi:cytochrome c peroxidase